MTLILEGMGLVSQGYINWKLSFKTIAVFLSLLAITYLMAASSMTVEAAGDDYQVVLYGQGE